MSLHLNPHDLFIYLMLLCLTTSYCKATVNLCTLTICPYSCNNTSLGAAWFPIMTTSLDLILVDASLFCLCHFASLAMLPLVLFKCSVFWPRPLVVSPFLSNLHGIWQRFYLFIMIHPESDHQTHSRVFRVPQ